MTDPEDDVDEVLRRAGFDAEASVLTRRQATILALRERGEPQAAIADRLGTSRANVANIEASARKNVEKARETVAFVEALRAPVRVTVEAGTDVYDVPDAVYAACDGADIKVSHTAPDLMKRVLDEVPEVIAGRTVEEPLVIDVTTSGELRVRRDE